METALDFLGGPSVIRVKGRGEAGQRDLLCEDSANLWLWGQREGREQGTASALWEQAGEGLILP